MSLPEHIKLYAALGTATLVLATGLAASYNAIIIPSIIKSKVKVKVPEKLSLWKQGHDHGKAIMIPIPLTGAALLAVTAYSIKDTSEVARTFTIAALLATGHIFTTLGFMLPTNNRLMSLEKQTVHSEAESKETDSLITKWTGLHAIRVGWLAAATVTAYVGLVAL